MMNIYRLNEFAKLIGKSVQTLQRWDRDGILKSHRSKTNRRYYTHDQYLEYIGQKATKDKKNIVYYRVSSSRQKGDFKNQKNALEEFTIARGIDVSEWLFDIGSGLNYTRKNFLNLLEMVERGEVSSIIIAHKDRFVRFGFEWFGKFCENHGTKVIIINQDSLSPKRRRNDAGLAIHYSLFFFKALWIKEIQKKDKGVSTGTAG